MPEPHDTFCSPRPFSRASGSGAGGVEDTDGIKTSAATPVVDTTYTTANFNGADAQAYLNSGLGPARTVSVTTGASVGTYRIGAGEAIVVTGTYAGKTVTESLALTATGGGETIRGSQPFDTVTSIFVPDQVNGSGTFQFGVQDVCGPKGRPFRAIKVHIDGTPTLTFQDGVTDALPMQAHVVESVLVYKVPRDIAVAFTVYA